MKNPRTTKILIQVGILVFTGLSAVFIALVSFGAIGGVAMGVAPEYTFGLVGGLVCPEGTEINYFSIKKSYHEPGEVEPHLECVGEDGAAQDVLLKAIGLVLGICFAGVFVVAFVVMEVPLGIVGWFVGKRWLGGGR